MRGAGGSIYAALQPGNRFAMVRSAVGASRRQPTLRRLEQRELIPSKQFPEVSIEADEMLAEMSDGGCRPGIRHPDNNR